VIDFRNETYCLCQKDAVCYRWLTIRVAELCYTEIALSDRCHAFGRSMEKVSSEVRSNVPVAKLDIDKWSELAEKFGVQFIPRWFYLKTELKPGTSLAWQRGPIFWHSSIPYE
jgi:hypothetical protein